MPKTNPKLDLQSIGSSPDLHILCARDTIMIPFITSTWDSFLKLRGTCFWPSYYVGCLSVFFTFYLFYCTLRGIWGFNLNFGHIIDSLRYFAPPISRSYGLLITFSLITPHALDLTVYLVNFFDWMGRGDNSETFSLLSLFYLTTPSWLKVVVGDGGGGGLCDFSVSHKSKSLFLFLFLGT